MSALVHPAVDEQLPESLVVDEVAPGVAGFLPVAAELRAHAHPAAVLQIPPGVHVGLAALAFVAHLAVLSLVAHESC